MSRRPPSLTDREVPHYVLGSVVRTALPPPAVERPSPPLARLSRARRSVAARIGTVAALVAVGFGAGWLIVAAQTLVR